MGLIRPNSISPGALNKGFFVPGTGGATTPPEWQEVSNWIAVWDFADTDSLTVVGGRIDGAADLSGSGIAITKVTANGALRTDDYADFDASSYHYESDVLTNLTDQNESTIYAEIYFPAHSTFNHICDGSVSTHRRMIRSNYDAGFAPIYEQMSIYSGIALHSGTTPAVNTWHRVIAIFSNTQAALWIDGVEVFSGGNSGTQTLRAVDTLLVGAKYDGSEKYKGRLGFLAVQDGAASAADISAVDSFMSRRTP